MLSLVFCAALLPTGAGADQAVAVWVRPDGIDDRHRLLLERLTVDEINKLEGWRAHPTSGVDDGVNGCAEDVGCLARLAAGFGAEQVVTVSVSRVVDTEVLTLRRTSLVDGSLLG